MFPVPIGVRPRSNHLGKLREHPKDTPEPTVHKLQAAARHLPEIPSFASDHGTSKPPIDISETVCRSSALVERCLLTDRNTMRSYGSTPLLNRRTGEDLSPAHCTQRGFRSECNSTAPQRASRYSLDSDAARCNGTVKTETEDGNALLPFSLVFATDPNRLELISAASSAANRHQHDRRCVVSHV